MSTCYAPPAPLRSRSGRDRLVERNEPLVKWWVRRLAPHANAHLRADLRQAGLLGLLRAAERFDEARGVPFSAFASACVRRAVADELGRAGVVTIPGRVKGEARGRLLEALAAREPVEGLAAAGPADGPDGEAIARALARLPARLAEVVQRRFWRNETLKQVGRALGVSSSRVQHLERRALARLRVALADLVA